MMKLATWFLCVCAVTLLVVHGIIAEEVDVEDADPYCNGNFQRKAVKGEFDLKTNTVAKKKYKIGNLSELCKCKIVFQYNTAKEELDYLFCRHEVGNEEHYSALDRKTMMMVDQGKIL